MGSLDNPGPPLRGLVSAVRTMRPSKGRRCALVIPHAGEACLGAHLALLAEQTDQEFDVILVSASPAPPPMPERGSYGLVDISLKAPLGAGGFYAGERFALERGYHVIILADADALPASRSLVGTLARAASLDTLAMHLPRVSSTSPLRRSPSIHWYGAIHRSALLLSGLTYAPLHFGGVDDELEARMLSCGIRMASHPAVAVSHPLFKRIPFREAMARALNDIRNRAPLLYCPHPSVWPLMPIHSAFSMLSFRGIGLAPKAFLAMIGGGERPPFHPSAMPQDDFPRASLDVALSQDGGVAAFALSRQVGDSSSETFTAACAGRCVESHAIFFEDSADPLSYTFRLAAGSLRARSAVVFSDWKIFFNPALLLYRRAYLHDGKETCLVAETPGALAGFLRFSLASAAFAALCAAYLPLSFISWLRHRGRSRRYGLGAQG